MHMFQSTLISQQMCVLHICDIEIILCIYCLPEIQIGQVYGKKQVF